MFTYLIILTIIFQQGNIYPIKEHDAFEELKSKAEQIDVSQIRTELINSAKKFVPPDLVYVPKAKKNYVYYINPEYTLPFDIPKVDSQGNVTGVLYPKGYKFNPLDYIKGIIPPLVIFNGYDKYEVQWVKRFVKQNQNAMLLTVTPSWKSVSEELKMPVFYLKKIIAERFKIKNTISVVTAEDRMIKVKVYAVSGNKN
jgi:conjugal transfer pilus assembly protein TraW